MKIFVSALPFSGVRSGYFLAKQAENTNETILNTTLSQKIDSTEVSDLSFSAKKQILAILQDEVTEVEVQQLKAFDRSHPPSELSTQILNEIFFDTKKAKLAQGLIGVCATTGHNSWTYPLHWPSSPLLDAFVQEELLWVTKDTQRDHRNTYVIRPKFIETILAADWHQN